MCTLALRNYPTKLKHLHRNSIIEYPQELPYQLYHHHRSPRRRRAPLFNFINTLPFARTFFITYQYNQPNWRRDRWKDTIITIPSAHFWWAPPSCVQTPGLKEATEKKTVPRSYHYPLLRASVSTRNSGSSHPPERSPSLKVGLTPAGVDAIGLNPISRSHHRADINRRPWCFSSTFNCTIPPRWDSGNQRNHPSLRWTPADWSSANAGTITIEQLGRAWWNVWYGL